MRPRIVAGNWKMNTTRQMAKQLASAVVQGAGAIDSVHVVLCPPFPYLTTVAEALAGSRVALGGQNCHDKEKGAFTGEVSAVMLLDVGCKHVILGHSERRHVLGESDAFISAKVKTALKAGLEAILCVGETSEERKAGRDEEVCSQQVSAGLAGLDEQSLSRVVIAYEPVWAIGTGVTAKPEEAQAMHAFIRGQLGKQFGEAAAARCPILYGGSVDREKAPALFAQSDIDGGLIGGASLKADEFLDIIKFAVGK